MLLRAFSVSHNLHADEVSSFLCLHAQIQIQDSRFLSLSLSSLPSILQPYAASMAPSHTMAYYQLQLSRTTTIGFACRFFKQWFLHYLLILLIMTSGNSKFYLEALCSYIHDHHWTFHEDKRLRFQPPVLRHVDNFAIHVWTRVQRHMHKFIYLHKIHCDISAYSAVYHCWCPRAFDTPPEQKYCYAGHDIHFQHPANYNQVYDYSDSEPSSSDD